MSSLNVVEKRYLESILNMGDGYVLNYSNATYGEFFGRHNVEIHSSKYQTYGTSKAKKMRAFWEKENDALVRKVLSEMLDSYETVCDLNGREADISILAKARDIVARLTGKPQMARSVETDEGFLREEFTIPNIQRLPVEQAIVPIIKSRLEETRKALKVGAHLAVIFLCGSVLEGVLHGAAQNEPEKFNRSPASPKRTDGQVKPFHEWSLAQFIDVATDNGILKPDVKKFSHGLRDFRNYIHPYAQVASNFAPDKHTARLCFQALKAALASVAGER